MADQPEATGAVPAVLPAVGPVVVAGGLPAGVGLPLSGRRNQGSFGALVVGFGVYGAAQLPDGGDAVDAVPVAPGYELLGG